MKTKNKIMTKWEVFFLVLSLVFIFIFGFMRAALCLVLLILIIILKKYMTNNNIDIKKKKSFLSAFVPIFIVYIGLFLFYRYGLDNINEYTLNQTRLYIHLPINMTILLGYLYNIKLRDFNWSINFKSFLIVLLLFIPFVLIKDMRILMENNIDLFYIRNFIQQLYYPAVVEEVIFRGYLLTGLLAYGVRKDKANVIQSIIFGLIHIFASKDITLIVILSTSLQMFLGFIFGKIYLRTKSLTPGIILHALINTI